MPLDTLCMHTYRDNNISPIISWSNSEQPIEHKQDMYSIGSIRLLKYLSLEITSYNTDGSVIYLVNNITNLISSGVL